MAAVENAIGADMSARTDKHVISFTVADGKAAYLSMDITDLIIVGVVYGIPEAAQLGQADIEAINTAYNALVAIAVTNGYNWPA